MERVYLYVCPEKIPREEIKYFHPKEEFQVDSFPISLDG